MQIDGTDDLSDLERTRGALTILGRDTRTDLSKPSKTFKALIGFNMSVGSFVALKSVWYICLTCRCAA